MNNINLIIRDGERPLFDALNLLKTILRDGNKLNNPYDSTKETYIYQSIVELHVASEILRIRKEKNDNHFDDLMPLLNKLPIIIDREFVKAWEVKKIWNNNRFSRNQQELSRYSQILDSSSPSDGYILDKDYIKNIWNNWLQQIDHNLFQKLIANTCDRLLLWNADRPKHDLFISNILKLVDLFNLPKESSFELVFFVIAGNANKELFDIYLKEKSHDINGVVELIKIWENSIHLKRGSLIKFLDNDSVWHQKGILNALPNKIENWDKLWNVLYNHDFEILKSQVENNKYILALFGKRIYEDISNENYWSHIEELPKIINSLKTNSSNIKILVHDKTENKNEFISYLLNQAGKSGWTIPQLSNTNHIDRINHLTTLNHLLKKTSNDILVVNDAVSLLQDPNYQSKKLINEQSIQIWSMNDIKLIQQDILADFTVVIDLPMIPFATRLNIISKFIKDKDIASRTAQSIKTLNDIKKLEDWCLSTDDYSWKNILFIVSSILKSENKNIHSMIQLNKVEIDKDLIDIAGNPHLIELMDRIKHFYQHPFYYEQLNAQPVKGILLTGGPGTGKTHFAKNISKAVDIPMFAPDTSILCQSPENIEYLFSEIKKYTPCILFLDEADGMVSSPLNMGSIDNDRQKIINSFLKEIDGIGKNEGLLVIAATHRYDRIDPAATRSGRLSEVIHLGNPNLTSRVSIWKSHLSKKPKSNIDYQMLAENTANFTGADIEEAVNRGSIIAAQQSKTELVMDVLIKACDDLSWGLHDYSVIMSKSDEERTAYHEAGHALIAWKNNLGVQRITITPRKDSLGMVQWNNEEGSFSSSIDDVKDKIQLALGGICAEHAIYGSYHNGGSSDLHMAKRILHGAILHSGLGEIGSQNAGDVNLWSNEKKYDIEKEEKAVFDEVYASTKLWLENHKNILEKLAKELLSSKDLSGYKLNAFKDSIKNELTKVELKIINNTI